jgi:hypothetical protein
MPLALRIALNGRGDILATQASHEPRNSWETRRLGSKWFLLPWSAGPPKWNCGIGLRIQRSPFGSVRSGELFCMRGGLARFYFRQQPKAVENRCGSLSFCPKRPDTLWLAFVLLRLCRRQTPLSHGERVRFGGSQGIKKAQLVTSRAFNQKVIVLHERLISHDHHSTKLNVHRDGSIKSFPKNLKGDETVRVANDIGQSVLTVKSVSVDTENHVTGFEAGDVGR